MTDIKTVAVTCRAYDQNGNPVAGGRFQAKLDRTEIYQGFVVPERVEGIADENGVCILNLWPNALGTEGSCYQVRAWNPDTGKRYLDTTAVVPDSDCMLEQIIVAEPYPTVDAAQQALIAAQGALAPVTAQAQAAAASALAAQDAEDGALAAESSAQLSAATAQSSQQAASISQASASSSATTATGAASTATSAADEAEAARDAAQSSSSTATAQATAASQSAQAANASADAAAASQAAAAESASTAQSHATTATNQAGVATTKAGEEGMEVTSPGNPALVASLAQDAGLTVSEAEIIALFATVSITEHDPIAEMARLGVGMCVEDDGVTA